MSTCRRETAPGAWDDARDTRFFRTTAGLFPPEVCLGATVLLSSYDDDPVLPPSAPVPAPVGLRPRVAPQPVRGRAA